ncbi:MAG: PAS domain-containing protein, partial [Kofleriaceae bacterium]|nr:PAS domain-containing protein [Kofleriaceae bacterium]
MKQDEVASKPSLLDRLAGIEQAGDTAKLHHEHMRRRILVNLSLLCTAIIIAAVIQRFLEFGGQPLTYSMIVVGAITFSPIITLQLFSDFVRPAKVLCIGGLFSLTLLTYMTDGIASPTMAWVAVVSLFATFIVGSRFGFYIGVLGSLIILGFFLIAFCDVPLPPVPDEKYILGGRVIALAGLSFAIGLLGYQFESERKRALKSSLQLQADFQVLIEDSPEGVVVLADNSIVYASPGLATILKFTNDELQNNNFIEFAHPKIRSRLTEAVENLRTPQGNEKRTFELVRGDSETVKLEIDH